MYLYTVSLHGKPTLAVSHALDGALYAISDYGFSFPDMNALIDTIQPQQFAALQTPPEAAPLEDYRILAPIPCPKQDILCLGINYNEHAEEATRFSKEAFTANEPEIPIYFSKRVSQAAGPDEIVPAYTGLVDSLDYEVELAVILGKTIKDCPEEAIPDAIFGYTVFNDFSARNLQTAHKQWYRGKSLDKHTAFGPCIVTADEIGWPVALDISCCVNGELRQHSNTRYMRTGIAQALSQFSQGLTLQSGTILATGTPSGVGMGRDPKVFLKPGDEVTCTIEKLGTLRNLIGE